MPMIELRTPAGALSDDARRSLAADLTTTFLSWRGAPNTDSARANAWVFISEWPADRQFVAGESLTQPHYVVTVSTVKGGMDAEAKQGLVAAITRQVLVAEGSADPAADGGRVWVFINEMPDGTWSAGGEFTSLADAQAALGLKS